MVKAKTEATNEQKKAALKELQALCAESVKKLCRRLGICDRCFKVENGLETETKCKVCASYMRKVANRIYLENADKRKKEKKEREIAKVRRK